MFLTGRRNKERSWGVSDETGWSFVVIVQVGVITVAAATTVHTAMVVRIVVVVLHDDGSCLLAEWDTSNWKIVFINWDPVLSSDLQSNHVNRCQFRQILFSIFLFSRSTGCENHLVIDLSLAIGSRCSWRGDAIRWLAQKNGIKNSFFVTKCFFVSASPSSFDRNLVNATVCSSRFGAKFASLRINFLTFCDLPFRDSAFPPSSTCKRERKKFIFYVAGRVYG